MTNVPRAPGAAPAGSPVYCSGPMFSEGDKFEQSEVAAALESAGFTTYLPQRDGIEVERIMHLVDHPILEGYIADKIMLEVRKWVFALDIYQLLSRCQSVVFNLDGRTPDDGSVVEQPPRSRPGSRS
jgi:nucleoside 2-deoxyribosyltransferase